MVGKLRSDLSVNSGLTGDTRAIVMPGIRIPRKKKYIKSLAMSSPRKDPITNQDKNTLGLQKYQLLPPHVPPFTL